MGKDHNSGRWSNRFRDTVQNSTQLLKSMQNERASRRWFGFWCGSELRNRRMSTAKEPETLMEECASNKRHKQDRSVTFAGNVCKNKG